MVMVWRVCNDTQPAMQAQPRRYQGHPCSRSHLPRGRSRALYSCNNNLHSRSGPLMLLLLIRLVIVLLSRCRQLREPAAATVA